MSILDKIKTSIGAAVAGGDILTNSLPEIAPLTSIVYQKEQGSKLMNDLIKKEVTEEVKQLRYRTYWVEEESYKYGIQEVDGEIKAVEKQHADFTKPNVFEETHKKVVLVQNTEPIASGVENNVDVMKEGVKFKQYYPLEIERGDYYPKFRFEKYCKQIVLKECENLFQLDLYMNIVPSNDDRIERNLTFELENLFNKKQKIFNLDNLNEVEFTTKNAWGNKNHIRHKLSGIEYTGITKFSSFYILHYSIKYIDQEDMIAQYYNENIAKEYENETQRPNMKVPFDIFYGVPAGTNRVEICDKCGKELKELERADYRLTKQEYGIGMCLECYKNFLKIKRKCERCGIEVDDDYILLKNKKRFNMNMCESCYFNPQKCKY
jgi:hypothetical protein